jgi:hypothetical protein
MEYLLEQNANTFSFDDVCHIDKLYILCYKIVDIKYPFLQFVLDKIDNGFQLPCVYTSDNNNDIQTEVFSKMRLNEQYKYKGVVFINVDIPCVLVDASNVIDNDIHFYALPSEIINNESIYNIPIDPFVVSLFQNNPYISLLLNKTTNKYYNIPDVAFTSDSLQEAEFKSVFGNEKTKVYNCREYYYFYRNYKDALTKEYITRYAVFVEGKIHLENHKTFSLRDKIIDTLYPEPTILICYTKEHESNPDLLVKSWENSICLSYYETNKL